MAKALSKERPSFFDNALLFLRVRRQVAPEAFESILSQIELSVAEKGWRTALPDRKGNRKMRSGTARLAIAWLVTVRPDPTNHLCALARRLLAALTRETPNRPT